MHVRMLAAGPVGGRGLAWPSFTVLQFSQPKNGQNHTCGASRRVCSAPTDIVTYPFLKTHASNPAFPTGLGLGLERFGFCSTVGVERRDRPRPFYRRYNKIIGRWSHSHPCWGRSVACWGEQVQRRARHRRRATFSRPPSARSAWAVLGRQRRGRREKQTLQGHSLFP